MTKVKKLKVNVGDKIIYNFGISYYEYEVVAVTKIQVCVKYDKLLFVWSLEDLTKDEFRLKGEPDPFDEEEEEEEEEE